MGIRIHKSIGYGFSPVPKDELNLDNDLHERIHESDFANYKAFLKNKSSCLEVLVNVFGENPNKASFKYNNITLFLDYVKNKARHEPWPPDFYDIDIERPEKFIVFYPHNNIEDSMFSSWSRSDDTLDYYENRVYGKEIESVIIDLSEYRTQALHPYDNFMFLKPGRENKTKYSGGMIDIGEYNRLIGEWDSDAKPWADKETIKHLEEDWGPDIPISIKLFCFYFNIFKNPSYIYNMKPLLCQWWN